MELEHLSAPMRALMEAIADHWPKAYETRQQLQAWCRAASRYPLAKVRDALPQFYDEWKQLRAPKGPDFADYLARNLDALRSDEELWIDRRLEQLSRAGRVIKTPSGRRLRIMVGGLLELDNGPFAPWSILTTDQKRDVIHMSILQDGEPRPEETRAITFNEYIDSMEAEDMPVSEAVRLEIEEYLRRAAKAKPKAREA